MQFESFDAFTRAVVEGRVVRGDVVYVARGFYEALSGEQRNWLWRHALDRRLRLVTDVDVPSPITVLHGAEPEGRAVESEEAAPD